MKKELENRSEILDRIDVLNTIKQTSKPGDRLAVLASGAAFTIINAEIYKKREAKIKSTYNGFSVAFCYINDAGQIVPEIGEREEKKKISPVEKLARTWLRDSVKKSEVIKGIDGYILDDTGSAMIHAPELDALTVAAEIEKENYIKLCEKYGEAPKNDYCPRQFSRFSSPDGMKKIFDVAPAADMIPTADLAKIKKAVDFIHVSGDLYINAYIISQIAAAVKITRAAVCKNYLYMYDDDGHAAVVLACIIRNAPAGAVELSDVFESEETKNEQENKKQEGKNTMKKENARVKYAAENTGLKPATITKKPAETVEASAAYTITPGTVAGAVEISFSKKPSDSIREALKNSRFRWNGKKSVWYGFSDAEEIRAELEAAGAAERAEEAAENTEKHNDAKASRRALDLWSATRTDDLPGYGTENELKKAARDRARANGYGYDRAAAEIIRAHLRERFPGFRFSVRSGGAGWLNSCDITIISGYAPKEYTTREVYGYPENVIDKKSALYAVLEYCEKLHNAFDADDGDEWADYGPHHDLYGSAEISYSYIATEPTAEQADALDAFRASFEAWTVAEEARREAEIRAEMERREEEHKEAEKRAAEDRAKVERIEAGAVVEEIPEAEQKLYNCLQGFGKACDLDELREQIATITEDGQDPHQLAKPSRRVTLTEDLYNDFCGLLMYDFSFLAGMGGGSTDDPRVTCWEDVQKLTAEQRETVVFYSSDCVAVYVGDDLRLVIDPQGYNYARYTMIPEGGAVSLPAPDTREFYTPAPMAEQLEAVKPGDVVTLFRDPIICGNMLQEAAGTVLQVDNAKSIIYIQEGRKTRGYYVKPGDRVQIYAGKITMPDNIRYKTNERSESGAAWVSMERDNSEKFELLRQYAHEVGAVSLVDTVPGFKPYEARTA